MWPFTITRAGRDKDYNPLRPSDANWERILNVGVERYELKNKGQAYSQVNAIGTLSALLGIKR